MTTFPASRTRSAFDPQVNPRIRSRPVAAAPRAPWLVRGKASPRRRTPCRTSRRACVFDFKNLPAGEIFPVDAHPACRQHCVSSIPVWCPAKQGSSNRVRGGPAMMAPISDPPAHAITAKRRTGAFILLIHSRVPLWRRPFNRLSSPGTRSWTASEHPTCPRLGARATSARSAGIFQCQSSALAIARMKPQALGDSKAASPTWPRFRVAGAKPSRPSRTLRPIAVGQLTLRPAR